MNRIKVKFFKGLRTNSVTYSHINLIRLQVTNVQRKVNRPKID